MSVYVREEHRALTLRESCSIKVQFSKNHEFTGVTQRSVGDRGAWPTGVIHKPQRTPEESHPSQVFMGKLERNRASGCSRDSYELTCHASLMLLPLFS